jgi:hypothetical protein
VKVTGYLQFGGNALGIGESDFHFLASPLDFVDLQKSAGAA